MKSLLICQISYVIWVNLMKFGLILMKNLFDFTYFLYFLFTFDKCLI